jgi:hypothetical protein
MAERLRLRDVQLEWREVEGQILALDLGDSHYLLVNESGCTIWEALSAGTTREALTDRLAGTYGLERERALDEVDAFLRELDARDLIVRD